MTTPKHCAACGQALIDEIVEDNSRIMQEMIDKELHPRRLGVEPPDDYGAAVRAAAVELPSPRDSEAPAIRFDAGPSMRWCAVCGAGLSEADERCPACGTSMEARSNAVVSKVDRASRTITVDAAATQFDPLQGGCSGCGRPEGIAHAYGCPVLGDEETKP